MAARHTVANALGNNPGVFCQESSFHTTRRTLGFVCLGPKMRNGKNESFSTPPSEFAFSLLAEFLLSTLLNSQALFDKVFSEAEI